jgi:hypothetical protein
MTYGRTMISTERTKPVMADKNIRHSHILAVMGTKTKILFMGLHV